VRLRRGPRIRRWPVQPSAPPPSRRRPRRLAAPVCTLTFGLLASSGAVTGGGTAGWEPGELVSQNVLHHAYAYARARSTPVENIVILDRPIASFAPARAFGAALDGHERGEIAQIYTPANERAMRSAGLGQVTYRLRTELGVTAWHFNPAGSWSEPARRQGYWTSSPVPGRPPLSSHGYDLPRRGDTRDQANDAGFSRLDDGSTGTFWKSNPYLDPHYTHEPHPQRVLVDFGFHRPVDALRIAWGTPWATRVRVQWWQGPEALLQSGHAPGRWRDFPRAAFAGRAGTQTLILARAPLPARFVRVLLSESSHTAAPGSHDVRDRLGFAIRELYVGRVQRGRFVDEMRHGVARQTVTVTSSTDPWHGAGNLDRNYEQPGFTTVLRSGLTRGEPVLVPVPVLYGTPENTVAELRYLRALGVPIAGVELGEEPNGQWASPEDYGALYVQFARALHRYDPTLRLGGPGYETSLPDFLAWPDARGDRSWTRRFIAYLRAHDALGELSFFSFEWYPFDNGCRPVGPQLARVAGMLAGLLHHQTLDGLPAGIPKIITEYGFSAFATADEVDLAGAVLDADVAAEFLALGGQTAYLYGYEPSELIRELAQCDTWGNLTLLRSDSRHRIKAPVAAFWGVRLLTQSWAQPGARPNTMLASSALGGAPVAAYALRRPDGRLSILLLNKDPRRARRVTLSLAGAAGPAGPLHGALEVEQLSRAQYVWHPRGENGYARPDAPPARSTVQADPGTALTLPPLSITVARSVGRSSL
jgi:hypothetical protein